MTNSRFARKLHAVVSHKLASRGRKSPVVMAAVAAPAAIIFALGRAADLGIKLAQECNRRGGKVVLVSSDEHDATEKLFPVKISGVPGPWQGITSLLVPQALTLAMVERTGCRLTPRFQYGVMEQ